MIKLTELSLQLGGKTLLDQATVTINPGERVAIIGANGSGKSSLFKVLQGDIGIDHGECHRPKNWRLSHMAQEVEEVGRTAIDFVLDGDTTFRTLERALDDASIGTDDLALANALADLDSYQGFNKRHEAEQLLAGLGFGQDEFENTVGSFSGGWRVRLNLARALMCPADLLLLDEPTNHLDLHTCYWLENWLRAFQGTLIFISHDRDFIDGVSTQVIHFDQQKLIAYRGNYSQFERQRSERLAQQSAAFEKQEAQRAHLESFVNRFKAKASKAKQAQSRVKMLEKLTLNAPSIMSHGYDLSIPSDGRVSDPVIDLRHVDLGYGDKIILNDINVSLHPGMRTGLLGVNGAGKSTLIKALSGDLTPLAGEIMQGQNLKVGYFAQHQLESLDDDASAFLHLRRIDDTARDQDIKNFIGRFGFSGERATEVIRHFSGGEKARIALAMIAWQKPNLLLLDEPTNHLDLDMREALNLALAQYEGAVILVSHDRYLLNTTAENFWWVQDGRVDHYTGDLDDYFQALLKAPSTKKTGNADKTLSESDKKVLRQAKADARKKLKPLQDALKKAEKEMDAYQRKVTTIENQLADTTLYEDSQKDQLQALLNEQTAAQQGLNEAEERWINAQEAMYAAELPV